jgi:hypothetical protein
MLGHRVTKRTPRVRLYRPAGGAPYRGSAEGATGVGLYPGRFMSHEVGVLET